MRLVSNKDSIARGEVSILAISETLLAIALVFYLSTHFNILRWLAVAMCVSPLLLLRTEESTRLGIEWFDHKLQLCTDWSAKRVKGHSVWSDAWRTSLLIPVMLPAILLIAFLARVRAICLSCLREPSRSVQAIPSNWVRATFSIDSMLPPELIPGHPQLTSSYILSFFSKPGRPDIERVVKYCCVWALIPSFAYRWSLKATSIIYAPLVFVAHSTFSEGADLRTKLELIKRGDLSRIRVWYGVIAITAFLVKLVLMMHLPGFADWWNGHPVSQFLALYVAPAEIPKWQLAELANSMLAVGAMLFARRALLGYELQHPWPEEPVKRLLGFVSGLRWVLALYAILCTGYITMRAAQQWHWPALGEKWLPW